MKTKLFICFCSLALVAGVFAQDPAATATSPVPATPAVAVTPAATAPVAPASSTTPTATPRASRNSRTDDDLADDIERNVKRGLQITIGDHGRKNRHHSDDSDFDENALMAIPIVGIIFSTLFGAPVLIVGLILFFSYWKQRSLHRTVRMMVEKGQPVPEGLFAPPQSPARLRSDMRRGVVLVMIGLGLIVFLGAVNDWDEGIWAIGMIPFLMGAGYLLVWKLEGGKRSTDNTPRLS